MQIVPIHYRISEKVRKFSDIKQDAAEMAEMLAEGKFTGYYPKGYALAHAQVSDSPSAFFVVDAGLVRDDAFEHPVIINPRVLESPVYHEFTKAEKKMKLDKNYRRVNHKQYEEGCLSFPYRRAKRLNRFDRIKVKYQTPGGLFGLKTHVKWLEGLPSQVFQHEYDHIMGCNIFFNGPGDARE